MPLWYKIFGNSMLYNRIHVKQRLRRKRKRFYESFSSRQSGRKSFVLTTHWKLAHLVNTCHGITVLRRLTVPKQTVLQNARYAESKNVRRQYYCSPVWTKSGGQIPWTVTAIFETLMSAHRTEKLPVNGVLWANNSCSVGC